MHPLKSGGVDAAVDRLARWAHGAGVGDAARGRHDADSPGAQQARDAVASGADLVLAWGGDGTVRSVAEGLAGTGVPLGILPAGTGNLLARNLGIPLSLDDAGRGGLRGRRAARRRPRDRSRRPGHGVHGDRRHRHGRRAHRRVRRGSRARSGRRPTSLNTVRAARQGTDARRRRGRRRRRPAGSPRAASSWPTSAGSWAASTSCPRRRPPTACCTWSCCRSASPLDWARTGARLALRRAAHDASRYHLQGTSGVGRHPRRGAAPGRRRRRGARDAPSRRGSGRARCVVRVPRSG